jgi:hypothetical protein
MITPKIKTQSKQCHKKCQQGPIKANVSASQRKQMVLAFMHNKRMVYTNYMPSGATGNADHIVSALRMFLTLA